MMAEKNAADDDAMRSSANALTKKLYHTVMDVFGNYACNDEDDYNNMLETLRNHQMQRHKYATPLKSDDTRGIIANKLLEGYVLHGDVCDKCVMPLMAYQGHISCVVCERVGELMNPGVPQQSTSVELALASTTESDLSEDLTEEAFVNKELSQFNEKRSQATHVYTAKILGGYVMHDQLCSKCDMPMMKNNDSVDCVFCPKKVKQEISELIKEVAKSDTTHAKKKQDSKKEAAAMNTEASDKPSEVPKPAHKLSQAETIVERLRGENVDSELEKVESELLKLIGSLGMQGDQSGEAGETLQEYFSKKKAGRAAEKKLKESSQAVIETEAVTTNERIPEAVRVNDEPIVATLVGESGDDASFVHPMAPVTPKFESSISCSIGNSFFPGLKNMFASASDPIKVEPEQIKVNTTHPRDSRLEAKKRIAKLVEEGWEVSASCCTQCDLPLFLNANGQTLNNMQRCVMCGPVTANTKNRNEPTQEDLNEPTQEDLTSIMVNRIMQGWSIVEGGECPSCHMPTMLDPQSRHTHCIACGVLPDQQATNNVDAMQITMQSKPTDVNTNPNAEDPAQPAIYATQNKLKVEIASVPAHNTLPDPTTSMYEFRGQFGGKLDPAPSVQVLQGKLNVATDSEPIHHTTGEPTPSMKTLRLKLNEPTPNMQAVRNKLYVSNISEHARHAGADPTPNMKTLKEKLNVSFDSEPAQYTTNAPTPSTETMRLKEPTPRASSLRHGKFNTMTVSAPTHPAKFGSVDPTPSNFNVSSRVGQMEAPGQK